ncbi:MBL fold metallo-hydrolase RNA specificity domain-containing protein [Acidobacteriota bacterium]
MKIQFLGACQQVTGSCTYLEVGNLRILVDCGMFQERAHLNKNWDPFPISPSSLDYILLTHVHLDHAGLIPRLVNGGFKGKILMTQPSGALLPVVLLDSAKIQEEDAKYKKKRHKKEGRKGPFPVVPLYSMEDAEQSLRLIEEVPYDLSTQLDKNVSVVFHDAGHILGSAMIELQIRLEQKTIKMVFSGDIGQNDKPLVKDPTVFNSADYVVMESTYGSRNHEESGDVETQLEKIILSTVKSGGNIIIPTFAIERAQELLYHLSRLVRLDRIPYLMMFLDSPMALDVTDVFLQNKAELDDETLKLFKEGQSPFRFPGLNFVRSTQESKAINHIRGSCVIMAGSGMCTGGRVKHHLVNNISSSESTILFVGYQASGTLGRLIVDGRQDVRIHGKIFRVKAKIARIDGFSAHADHNALLKWLDGLSSSPKKVFLVHGEKNEAQVLKNDIVKNKSWNVEIPEYKEEYEIL